MREAIIREPLELNECLRRFLAELASQSAWRPAQFTVVVDLAPAPLWLLGSETHLQRAVSNLVHNAVDATEGHGCLRVRTFARSVSPEEVIDANCSALGSQMASG